jgi:glycosyltransferase involved in cell wall biosynthesis
MAGNVYRVPSFVGVGESTLWAVDPIGLAKAAGELRGATGFAAVSTMSARLVTDTVDIGNARMGVFPNGVDHKIFFPRDRAEMRKKWGLDAERFLVAFLGRFEEEKGLGALVAAIRRIPEAGLILLGRGSQQFAGEQICFSGAVKHECVPELLSAADLFVLPTESEGCSNATIEAMACGLPVVTSAGAFMDEVVGDCAIRVDPRSLDEIEGAVRRLREDEQLRISLGMRSRERSLRFDATGRAKALVAWMAEAVAGGGHEL